MSPATRLHLKQPTGWFAAGREIEHAITLLSDGAFKLFLWLCLHAERSRGSLSASPAALASALHKSETEMQVVLDELFHLGVCNTADGDLIEIADRFWPYHRASKPGTDEDLARYIAQVKHCFLQRRCVRSTFTPTDEKLAAQLFHNGVAVVDVEHAILLGSLRKYVAWVNHGQGSPITTLHYFTGLFNEVHHGVSSGYWSYVSRKLRAFEQDSHGEPRQFPSRETK
jgi:hypothetical protein